tara:strand:+ start:503 stop:682 length:180 start_codon:yes stop_codon:yes gene_type:complete
MKTGIKMLIRNLKKVEKLPLERLPWKVDMLILDMNCEIGNFLKIYNKLDKLKKIEHLKK